MNKILQFWLYQIVLLVLLVTLSLLFIFFFKDYILQIPRSGTTFLATIFSTLLGLTFTAFAIIGAFMPNVERDFLNTHTFETFISTFRITMIFELFSLVLSIIDYFIFGTVYFQVGLYILIVSITLSLGFVAYLLNKTFKVFKITRKQLIHY